MDSLLQPQSSRSFEQAHDLRHQPENLVIPSRIDCQPNKDSVRTKARIPWLDSEIVKLASLARERINWKTIAKAINLQYHQGKRIRHPRDCKKQWISHKQKTQSSFWTPQEDRILLDKVKLHGRKWKKIAEFFYEKSTKQIKCRLQFLNKKKNNIIDLENDNNEKKNILDFGDLYTNSYMSMFFNPLQSFRVQSLSDVNDFGFNMAKSFCDPDVRQANLVLDDFCIKEFSNDV